MQAKTFAGFSVDWSLAPAKSAESIADGLEEMLDLQRGLMVECRADEIPNDLLLYITLNNIVGEATEAASFFGDITKPWKKDLTLPLDEVQEELVDILHFLLQAFTILGMDANDITSLYRIKNGINYRRIRDKRKEVECV